jgi:hypothetical protein
MTFPNRRIEANLGPYFPMNSCMEFMWGNLPLVGGKRTLPSQENPPYGRWDGIRALLSAEKARSVMQAEVWEEEKKQAPVLQIAGSQVSEHLRRLHAPPPPTKYIWIKHPFDGYRKLAYWELKSVRDLFIRDPALPSEIPFHYRCGRGAPMARSDSGRTCIGR